MKRIDPKSPEYRDLLVRINNTKINLPPLTTTLTISAPVIHLDASLPLLPPITNFPILNLPSLEKYKIKERTFSKILDVDIKILLELSYKDVINTCQVNSYLSELCKNNSLWRNKLIRDFPKRSASLYYPEYVELFKNDARKLYEIINSKSKIENRNYYKKTISKYC